MDAPGTAAFSSDLPFRQIHLLHLRCRSVTCFRYSPCRYDKEAKMRDLEKYMKDLSEDVTDMLGDMTPEERSMIKAKMSTLVSKM